MHDILIAGRTATTLLRSLSPLNSKGNTTQFSLKAIQIHCFFPLDTRQNGSSLGRHTARTPSWKNDDTVQNVLFSRGSGDIFQRGIHHAVTARKLKEQKKKKNTFKESLPFFFDDRLQSSSFGKSRS